MKYLVHVEIDPESGLEVEAQPKKLEEWIGKWQALSLIGMYFCLTRRAVTIILDVPDEDAMFEAIHSTWILAKSYPDIWPIADASEFPALMQRIRPAP
jgi:hypothetical protein